MDALEEPSTHSSSPNVPIIEPAVNNPQDHHKEQREEKVSDGNCNGHCDDQITSIFER